MSHVNSYPRGVLDDRTAYDAFVDRFGDASKAFLNAMGIRKIPPEELLLKPALLGERFARHAARVTLRRNGVLPAATTK